MKTDTHLSNTFLCFLFLVFLIPLLVFLFAGFDGFVGSAVPSIVIQLDEAGLATTISNLTSNRDVAIAPRAHALAKVDIVSFNVT